MRSSSSTPGGWEECGGRQSNCYCGYRVTPPPAARRHMLSPSSSCHWRLAHSARSFERSASTYTVLKVSKEVSQSASLWRRGQMHVELR